MRDKVHREVLSQRAGLFRVSMCAPPSSKNLTKGTYRHGSLSLCSLKKGNLTIEAALIMPFFLTVLLAFFSYFLQYSLAAGLSIQAAAEAKKIGVALATGENREKGDVVIYKSGKTEQIWEIPFVMQKRITESAVCRGWTGFTELETDETYVYITPEGNVYHLSRNCTHLDLSIQRVTFRRAAESGNAYGETYRECELCHEPVGLMVYITDEGNCYHSERSCSGLKRTVRQVPVSEVNGRSCCSRCLSGEE